MRQLLSASFFSAWHLARTLGFFQPFWRNILVMRYGL